MIWSGGLRASDSGSAGKVRVQGGWLGVHRGLWAEIDDTTMNALFDQEAKLFLMCFAAECYRGQGRSDRLQPLRLTPFYAT